MNKYGSTDRVNIMNPKYFITRKQPDFQRTTVSLKVNILIKAVKESCSPSCDASLAPLKPKEGRKLVRKGFFGVGK